MKPETIAAHASRGPENPPGDLIEPIHLSTTFERGADGGYPHGYSYSRAGNPNRTSLERTVAALEGGADAAAFASGSAATAAVFGALSPGDHVIASDDCYHGTTAQLRETFHRWGLEADFCDTTNPDSVTRAMTNRTRLLWVETPSNPLLRISDLTTLSVLAAEHGAVCVCDNTWATPLLQRPLVSGCDLVVHATTKYLSGHSDVLGGVVVARPKSTLFPRVRQLQAHLGAVPSPFDCWLVLRGIRTLAVRVRAQTETAGRLASFLHDHPAVDAVHYPGLTGHPGHDLAARQMQGAGAMISFLVSGGEQRAMQVAAAVRTIVRATSLGGTESLIEHRASMEGPGTRTPQDLLRLSVGLEHVDDLIADLTQALNGSAGSEVQSDRLGKRQRE